MTTYNIEIREFNGTDYDVFYPVTIEENILNLTKIKVFTPTLSKSSWKAWGTGFYCEATIEGVFSTDYIICTLNGKTASGTGLALIEVFKNLGFAKPSATNKVRFYYSGTTKPTIDLPLIVFAIRPA